MQPRPMTQIRSIEASSRCDLACVFCVHPRMSRPKVDMSEEHWRAALDWVRFFVQRGTQGEINISGTGEPTLHPDLPRFCTELRAIIGPDVPLLFTTNGKGLTEELVAAVAPAKPRVCVSAHHAFLAGPAAVLLHKYGLLRSISFDPVLYPQDWAGQVQWAHPPQPLVVCAPLRDGLGFIAADGSLLTCCQDTSNESKIGDVLDAPNVETMMRDWRVCPKCWQYPPKD